MKQIAGLLLNFSVTFQMGAVVGMMFSQIRPDTLLTVALINMILNLTLTALWLLN